MHKALSDNDQVQTSNKIYHLISELDSTKFDMKTRLEEKERKIKELQLSVKQKDQEIAISQKYLEIKKEELKAKESYILKVEKSCSEIKHKCQQEITRIENEKISLENHYLRELTALKSEKEEVKSRLVQQTQREKDISTRLLGGVARSMCQERYDPLIQEIDTLREDRNHLASQLHAQQLRNQNIQKENEHSKKLLEESQEMVKELEGKIQYLSQELEKALENKHLLESSYNDRLNQLNATIIDLQGMVGQLGGSKLHLDQNEKQMNKLAEHLTDCTQQLIQINLAQDSKNQKFMKINEDKNIGTCIQENTAESMKEKDIKNEKSKCHVAKENLRRVKINPSISKETSPKHSRRHSGVTESTAKHLYEISSREKEINGKASKFKKGNCEVKTKNNFLNDECGHLTAKIEAINNENQGLRQELEKTKSQILSTCSNHDDSSIIKEESKKMRKLVNSYESDLKKANLEIKKLMAVKEELELIIKEMKEDKNYAVHLDLPREKSGLILVDLQTKDVKNFADQNSQRDKEIKTYMSSKPPTASDQEEINRILKENDNLRSQLDGKDSKLQNLMKLSTDALKVITEEFFKMTANKLFMVHQKITKTAHKWSNIENLVKNLIHRYLNMSLYCDKETFEPQIIIEGKRQKEEGLRDKKNLGNLYVEKSTERGKVKKNFETPLTSRAWREDNNLKHNLKLTRTKSDIENRSKSFERRETYKENLNESHSQVSTQLKKIDKHLKSKSKVDNKTKTPEFKRGRFEKESFGKLEASETKRVKGVASLNLSANKEVCGDNIDEEEFNLEQILEEIKDLEEFFVRKEDGTIEIKQPQTLTSDTLTQQQKIIELIQNAIMSEFPKKLELEDIKEVDHETDTLQDEPSNHC